MPKKKKPSPIEIENKTYQWLEYARTGDIEMVKFFYEQHPYIDINMTLFNNENALHLALTSYDDRSNLIKYLLEIGVNPEEKKSNNGWTALMTACNYAMTHDKNLDALMTHNVDIHVRARPEHSNNTVLHLAVEDIKLDRLKKFIDLGVNPYLLNKYGENILHIAAVKKNNESIVEYLLESQFNFNLNLVAQGYNNQSYTVFDTKNQIVKKMLESRLALDKIYQEKDQFEKNVVEKLDKTSKVKL